jgi:hypothetical protein
MQGRAGTLCNSPPTLHAEKKYLRRVLRRDSIPQLDGSSTARCIPTNKMSYEYVVMTALIGWCSTPSRVPWWWPKPGPDPDPPPYNTFISYVYYVSLAGLILTTVATHPTEASSLRYGPFMLAPAIQIVAGLYQSNAAVRAATTKAKM